MKAFSGKKQVLIKNPNDGKTYDFGALFSHLQENELTISDIAEQLKKSIDTIPLLINQQNIDYLRDFKEIIINLQDLRDVFSSIKSQ